MRRDEQKAEPEELHRLDHQAKAVIGLFAGRETITASPAAAELGLSECMARNLLADWVRDGWLKVADLLRLCLRVPDHSQKLIEQDQNIGLKMQTLNYRIRLMKEEVGGYTVIVPAMPGCVTFGEKISEAVAIGKRSNRSNRRLYRDAHRVRKGSAKR